MSKPDIPSKRIRRFPAGRPGPSSRLCLLAVLVLAPFLAWGKPLDLEEAVEIARERNPDLLAARGDLDVARGHLVRARYWNPFNPEIEGGVTSRRFGGGGAAKQGSAAASIELEVAGQRRLRIEEAEANLARVEAEVADVERRILADVTTTFHRVLYAQRRTGLFDRIERLNERLRDASAERFAAGEAPKLEANLAAIRYDRARKDRLAAGRDLENTVRALERLLGVEPDGTLKAGGALEVPDVVVDAEKLVEAALRHRPDLREQEREIVRVEAEADLTRRLMVPNPTIGFVYAEEVEAGGTRDRIFGGNVSLPIPIFDSNQAELAALAGRRDQARHRLQAAELTVRRQVRDAVRAFRTARKAVDILEGETSDLVDESFDLVETAYRRGKIDLLRLVAVENDLIDSRLSHLESLWDYWRARAELERAVGARLEEVSEP